MQAAPRDHHKLIIGIAAGLSAYVTPFRWVGVAPSYDPAAAPVSSRRQDARGELLSRLEVGDAMELSSN